MNAAIEMTIEPRRRPVGNGFVNRLLPFRMRRMVGPFIFADLIGPDELRPGSATNVDAHPHIGLSTVTYLFDGRMVHRDSTGAVQTIDPGAVNWMTAGSGVTHTERSHPEDVSTTRVTHGLQTWVALPVESEETGAAFQHAGAAELPVESSGTSAIRLAVGTGWGLASPVIGSSPLVLAEIRLGDMAIPIDTGHAERAAIAVDGEVTIDGARLPNNHLAVLGPGHNARLGGTGRAIVLGGEPVGRRHIWWNFVHSDPDRIEQAKSDWSNQRFAQVPGDHDPWVPLPGG